MDDDKPNAPPDPDPLEAGLRRRLRLISGVTFLGLLFVITIADTFGQAAGFHANELIFGSLLGAFLLVAGVEGTFKVLGRK